MTEVLGNVGAVLAVAIFLATVNKALLDLIVAPVRRKLPQLDLWWVDYVALVTGVVLAWVFQINLLAAVGAGGEPARITGLVITGLAIGGGTDLINDIFSGVQGRTTTRYVETQAARDIGPTAGAGGPRVRGW